MSSPEYWREYLQEWFPYTDWSKLEDAHLHVLNTHVVESRTKAIESWAHAFGFNLMAGKES